MRISRKKLAFTLFFFFLLFFNGCSNLFKTKVKFEGKVYRGHYGFDAESNLDTDNIVIDGFCANARIKIEELNKVVLTDSDGTYTVECKVNRKFTSMGKDQYTVKALPPANSVSPAEADPDSVVVYAESGDTVDVPPLMVIVYAETTTGGQITFKGQVYKGHHPTDADGNPIEDILVIDGPCPGAIVQVVELDGTAVCDSNGQYTLTVNTTQNYISPTLFTIQAFPPRYSGGAYTSNDANDEYTTVYARTGDVKEVRPLVLVEYTDEDKNF